MLFSDVTARDSLEDIWSSAHDLVCVIVVDESRCTILHRLVVFIVIPGYTAYGYLNIIISH